MFEKQYPSHKWADVEVNIHTYFLDSNRSKQITFRLFVAEFSERNREHVLPLVEVSESLSHRVPIAIPKLPLESCFYITIATPYMLSFPKFS